MGDLNVNYLADRVRQNEGLPTRTLGDLVNFDMPLTGSRGATSLLDYGMTVKEDGGLQLLKSRIEYGFNSDHDAVVFDYGTVDLFATGGVFNRPSGTANEKREVIARAVRAVGNAEPGARIRLAAERFDDPELANALLAAYQRGVVVQVAPGRGLGHRRRAGPGHPDRQRHPAAVVGEAVRRHLPGRVGQAGGELPAGQPLGWCHRGEPRLLDRRRRTSSAQRWNDAFLSTDTYVYTGYDQTFDQMAADTTDTRATRQVTWGPSYTAQLYPMPAGAKDPMLKVLKRVKCKTGKNVVRASVAAWQGQRGKALAEQLVTMKAAGCDVRAILGKQVKKAVRKLLTTGRIKLIGRPLAQNVLFVKGKLGSKGVTRAYVGGPGWTDKGLVSDGVTLAVNDKAAKGYLQAFYRVWKNK